jgi:hypothetical protein
MSSSYKSSSYKCLYYSCIFTSLYALKWYISNKHQNVINKDKELTTQMKIVEKLRLWNENIIII